MTRRLCELVERVGHAALRAEHGPPEDEVHVDARVALGQRRVGDREQHAGEVVDVGHRPCGLAGDDELAVPDGRDEVLWRGQPANRAPEGADDHVRVTGAVPVSELVDVGHLGHQQVCVPGRADVATAELVESLFELDAVRQPGHRVVQHPELELGAGAVAGPFGLDEGRDVAHHDHQPAQPRQRDRLDPRHVELRQAAVVAGHPDANRLVRRPGGRARRRRGTRGASRGPPGGRRRRGTGCPTAPIARRAPVPRQGSRTDHAVVVDHDHDRRTRRRGRPKAVRASGPVGGRRSHENDRAFPRRCRDHSSPSRWCVRAHRDDQSGSSPSRSAVV